jgi:hypothetical protein
VTCLDCGKEFAYDWHEMKIIEPKESHFDHLAAARAESYAGE